MIKKTISLTEEDLNAFVRSFLYAIYKTFVTDAKEELKSTMFPEEDTYKA